MHLVDVDYLVKKYPEVEDEIRSLERTAPKRLMFALKVAETGNQTQSYLDVYGEQNYDTAGGNASKYRKDYRVSALIDAISHESTRATIEKIEFNREKILADIEKGKHKALDINQLGPYMRGCELQGKEIGMFVDRSEHIHRTHDGDLLNQLAELAPGLAAEAGKALALPGEFEEIEDNNSPSITHDAASD